MSKYIDAEKLIAEIERQKKAEGWCEVGKDTADEYYARGFRFACNNLLAFIDTFQQEQPQVADASKMERLNVDILRDWSMKFASDIRDAIEATAYHFWNLAINAIKEE